MDYRSPIRVGADDAICSATSMNGTIIGVLFEKKGSEIKKALSARLEVINAKIAEYDCAIANVDEFITEKRAILKELDEYYQERCDTKDTELRPYHKEVDEITKKYFRDFENITQKCEDIVLDLDTQTNKEIEKKAIRFEKNFDEFSDELKEFDEFIKEDDDPVRGIGYGDTGLHGPCGATGIQGITGIQGLKGDIYSSGNIGIGGKPPEKLLNISSRLEDRAVTRMNTLRNILENYVTEVRKIKNKIVVLENEKRRLLLMKNNINDDRDYKLDLNKLSAFGFEDIEIN